MQMRRRAKTWVDQRIKALDDELGAPEPQEGFGSPQEG